MREREGGGRDRQGDVERRSERIAASECKSTASDQSTTRTTRNRKGSLFLLIFLKFPPLPFLLLLLPPPPLPSIQRSHLFCLLAGYFSLGGAPLIGRNFYTVAAECRKISRPPRDTCAPPNRAAQSRVGRFADISIHRGNEITQMMFIRSF